MMSAKKKSRRGFASMDAALRRKLASKGGKSVTAKGTGHQWSKEEAKLAGSKGGCAARDKGTAHRFNTESAKAAAKARMKKRGR
jgi:hypothetical protein